MKGLNYKLLCLLRTLDEQELETLEKYMQCYLCKLPPTAIRLFECIIQEAPDFNALSLTPKALANQFAADSKNPRRYITDLFSLLAKEVDNFLTIQQLQKDSATALKLRTKQYENRNLLDLRDTDLKKNLAEAENAPYPNWEQTELLQYFYKHLVGSPSTLQRYSLEKIQEIKRKNLAMNDRQYLISKLIFATDIISQKITRGFDIGMEFLKQTTIWAAVKQEKDLVIRFYYQIFQFHLKEFQRNDYEDLLDLFYEVGPHLSFEEIEFAYNKLVVHANRQIVQGHYDYDRYAVQLMKHLIKLGYLDYQHEIPTSFFLNASNAGTTSGQTEWVEKYIHLCKDKLAPNDRDLAIKIAYCYIWLRDERAPQIFETLFEEDIRHPSLQNRIYTLLIRSVYKSFIMGSYGKDALLSRLRITSRFINKHKNISNHRRIGFKNLIKAIRKLIRLHENIQLKNEIDEGKIRQDFQKLVPIRSGNWVQQELNHLLKKAGN
ncbi:MAG: hypothetical protein GYB31_17435 [Bacteroidetes bacterium]|nr:hypothetical protein [Bacteroidota bacterium]